MKILFVGRKFGGVAGGVERMTATLINALFERGHELSLLTWDHEGAQTFFPLDKSTNWQKLSLGDPKYKGSWITRIRRQFRIRQIVKSISPDVIVAFQHGAFLAVRLATTGMGIPVIAAERNAPQRFDHIRKGRYRSLIFLSFSLAWRITIQFEQYRRNYPSYLHGKLVPIPNPVYLPERMARPHAQGSKKKVLLFVGHLAYQKNPEVLVKAFGILSPDFPDWELHLVGRGDYQKALEQLVLEYNIEERVRFLGLVEDMGELYHQAHLFCLPSRWEGFPNALAEALAHGLPAVGFAEAAGINLLIEIGVNGLLALGNNDSESLSQALRKLMESDELRAQFGKAARVSVKGYEPQTIIDRWERLLLEAVR